MVAVITVEVLSSTQVSMSLESPVAIENEVIDTLSTQASMSLESSVAIENEVIDTLSTQVSMSLESPVAIENEVIDTLSTQVSMSLESPVAIENEVSEIDALLTTCVSEKPAIESVSRASRCWNAVSSIWESFRRGMTLVWRYTASLFCSEDPEPFCSRHSELFCSRYSEPFCTIAPEVFVSTRSGMNSEERLALYVTEISSVDTSNVDKLLAFNHLIAAYGAVLMLDEGWVDSIKIQLRAGYDALPVALKNGIDLQLAKAQADEETKVSERVCSIDAHTDLRDEAIASAVMSLYQILPSVALSTLQTRIFEALIDEEKVHLILEMGEIATSDLDPSITEGMLDQCVQEAMGNLDQVLQDQIKKEMLNAVLDPDNKEQGVPSLKKPPAVDIMINNITISTDDDNFSSWVLQKYPRGSIVRAGLLRWIWIRKNVNHSSHE